MALGFHQNTCPFISDSVYADAPSNSIKRPVRAAMEMTEHFMYIQQLGS